MAAPKVSRTAPAHEVAEKLRHEFARIIEDEVQMPTDQLQRLAYRLVGAIGIPQEVPSGLILPPVGGPR